MRRFVQEHKHHQRLRLQFVGGQTAQTHGEVALVGGEARVGRVVGAIVDDVAVPVIFQANHGLVA